MRGGGGHSHAETPKCVLVTKTIPNGACTWCAFPLMDACSARARVCVCGQYTCSWVVEACGYNGQTLISFQTFSPFVDVPNVLPLPIYSPFGPPDPYVPRFLTMTVQVLSVSSGHPKSKVSVVFHRARLGGRGDQGTPPILSFVLPPAFLERKFCSLIFCPFSKKIPLKKKFWLVLKPMFFGTFCWFVFPKKAFPPGSVGISPCPREVCSYQIPHSLPLPPPA